MGGAKHTQFFVTAKPGVQISVHDLGGRGPALLFSHANGFHGLCYIEMARHMTHCCHCYAIDHRGSGDSQLQLREGVGESLMRSEQEIHEASATLPTIEGFMEDIAAVVNHLGCDECYLFGHSSGGTAALAATVKLPQRIQALYVYEPVIYAPEVLRSMPPEERHNDRQGLPVLAMRRRESFPSRAAAFDSLSARGFSSFDKAVLRAYVDHGFRDLPDGGCELKCPKACEAVVYANIDRMSAAYFHLTASLDCPVTVGCGGPNTSAISLAVDLAAPLAGQLRHGQLERFDHLDHFASFVDPAFMAARVLASFDMPEQHAKL